ncbi:MAG TPA: hypothetical protein PLP65_04810 [Bacteroidales bacterium]|jgi:hypothetical protein|nr:hypothetical protein [Bacteroidales bacterium]HOU98148.1 hypothetical protein [Bacteroidales bacterium]
MAPKKKINKLKNRDNSLENVEIWGLLSQKPSHALVKAINDQLEIKLDLIDHQAFHIYSFNESVFLIKNPKIDFFSEMDVDYLLVFVKDENINNSYQSIFPFLKNNTLVQGAYLLTLPIKLKNSIIKIIQPL